MKIHALLLLVALPISCSDPTEIPLCSEVFQGRVISTNDPCAGVTIQVTKGTIEGFNSESVNNWTSSDGTRYDQVFKTYPFKCEPNLLEANSDYQNSDLYKVYLSKKEFYFTVNGLQQECELLCALGGVIMPDLNLNISIVDSSPCGDK